MKRGLNDVQIALIRDGLVKHLHPRDIANAVGCSITTVYNWINKLKSVELTVVPAPPHPIVPEAEFGQLLIECRPRLERWMTYACGNRAMAEDIISITFIKALEARKTFYAGTNFYAWIFRIAKNFLYSDCRQRKNRKTFQMPEQIKNLAVVKADGEGIVMEKEILLLIITKLTWEQRDTVLGICYEGLGYEELAARYGVSAGTIKSRLWRGRSRLKQLLGSDGGIDGTRFVRRSGENGG